MRVSTLARRARCGLLISSALLLPQTAFAQADAAGADPAAEDAIIVTGFRGSLNAAISAKRDSASQIDVIVAEDIAKFPDTNLAESLQRIPGVAIQRDAGEGRAIVVRGLGAQFTRVRINGMEANATSVDGAGVNNERGFDFNVFASELFSSLVVHKTASASLDEGSLGAVVDLNTGNPLALDAGFSLVASAQVRYNDLSENAGPRLAGLVGWTNDDGTFGVSVSAAFSQYETSELGNNTVRWQQAAFRSVNGTSCFTGSTYVPSPSCDQAGLAFHPRIPRYGLVAHDRERLGLTGSIQWEPSDRTSLSIDGLFSNFKGSRDEYWGEVLFRSNERTMDVTAFEIDSNNNMISATINNAWVRTERYRRENETQFYQVSAAFEHMFTDRLTLNLLGGMSNSDAEIPLESTLIFDDRDFNGFTYDYSDMFSPQLTYGGAGIGNPTQFQLAEFRDRPSSVTNEFETVTGGLTWEATDNFSVEAGGLYRKFIFDSVGFQRDSTYCARFTCVSGQYGLAVTSAIAETFNLGSAGQPAGNTNSWVVPQLNPAAEAVGLYSITATVNQGATRSVEEKVTGGFLQINWDTDALGLRVTGNLGTRYVRTDQSSTGFVSGVEATVVRDYDDWLPAANVNLFLTDDLILRGAVGKVLTRPSLGNLTPGGSVDQFNFRITSGNPFLEPFRATAYDASLEWYFAPGALVSVAVFAKDIESFTIGGSTTGTYAESGLPTSLLTPGTPLHNAIVGGQNVSVPIEFRTTLNGEGANLKGIELSLNLPFDVFGDGFFSNFGILGNVTLVDSDVDYSVTGPATVLNGQGNPADPTGVTTAIYTRPLFNLAKKAANGTIYYEDDRFSARASVAYRGGYIDSASGTRNVFEGYNSSLNVDASIRYQLTEMISLSLEGTNLTDDYRERFTNDLSQRNYENNHFGRVFMAGVRVQM